jgi:hypothetical protein
MSCNCISTPCGCTETALTSPVTTVCNNTEPCEEITAFECVSYTGNNIYDIGINTGDRLDVVIKKLALYLTDPTCFDPTAVCQSIKDFEILDIKVTEGTVFWSYPGAPAAITAVKLEYSTSPTFATGVVQVALASTYTQWTIINLLANTTYYVRIKTSTSSFADCCTSITLSFKTLTA